MVIKRWQKKHFIEKELRNLNIRKGAPDTTEWCFDLFKKFPFLKKIVKMKSFHFAMMLPNLALFTLFLAVGILAALLEVKI